MKLTLIRKLLIGFSIMVLLIMVTGIYVIVTLRSLRAVSESVVLENLPAIETSRRLTESLLAQDLYEKRFGILREPAVATLFISRGEEFQTGLREWTLVGAEGDPLNPDIHRLHEEYLSLFKEKQQAIERQDEARAREISESLMQSRFEALLELLSEAEKHAREDQNQKIVWANETSQEAFRVTFALVAVSLIFGIGFTVYINSNLSYSIQQLQEAVRYIGRGLYDRALNIKATDEVGELADSFRWMSKRLKELGEMNLDANPLTRLPGNHAIEKFLLTRLQEGDPFAFCLADLDNFKAFGDRYGYSRGSDVLKLVSTILTETVKTLGTDKDFVGHIGGDDFVIISDPSSVDKLCGTVINDFDEIIPNYYDEDDRQQGFIISKDRKDVE
ncbi:MAG TPA: diguanylate cyclase, partial [Nitrospiria bacterium]|nr:diguanylate cyclase [Nitrospiria bacterium]